VPASVAGWSRENDGRGHEAKCDFIRENLERLDAIEQSSFERFSSDPRNLDSALYRLQTTIQALIDIGSYVTASLGLPTPEHSRDILEALERAGHLPPGSVARFAPMFAFRNRVVHLYDRVEPRIVSSPAPPPGAEPGAAP
jgi:uncharacterized protein YutE (UPF0331/DUF86 family)